MPGLEATDLANWTRKCTSHSMLYLCGNCTALNYLDTRYHCAAFCSEAGDAFQSRLVWAVVSVFVEKPELVVVFDESARRAGLTSSMAW